MTSGTFLPFAALSAFSPAFQAELAKYINSHLGFEPHTEIGFNSTQVEEGDEPPNLSAAQDDKLLELVANKGDEPPDLSVTQINKLLERVSDKVRNTLRVIAKADPAGFDMKAVLAAMNLTEPGELRGVWGGITKRVRTVLGDSDAYLIWWTEQDHDWVGRVSPMTHRSLGKALGI